MPLLQEHNVYLEQISAAMSTYMQALAGALTVMDSPNEYNMESALQARQTYDQAATALVQLLQGAGAPGGQTLKIYKFPQTLSGAVQLQLAAPNTFNTAVVPRFL